ncbi:MAG: ATP-binding cassette domain-containing protein [Cytophagales bacterium]|nr:ATP-binding cassette domain-containing protein [Cytophagales bacterium]
MIQVKGLEIEYDGETYFQNFDFSVEKGEKLAIIGESGTGKSTLLHLLAGFIPAFGGTAKIDGLTLTPENISKIRQKIAYLPQDIGLNMSSVEDMFFTPFEFELNKDKRPSSAEVEKIFEEFGLGMNLLSKKVNEISGGQKQRVLLASCLLLKKEIILLDEPTSALDKNIREKITNYILAQQATVITVTHDDYWIEKSDRTLHIKR